MICMRLFLPFILAVSLLSGCGLSDDTRDQLEKAIGKAAGEAWDSTKTMTARLTDEISTKIEEHGGMACSIAGVPFSEFIKHLFWLTILAFSTG